MSSGRWPLFNFNLQLIVDVRCSADCSFIRQRAPRPESWVLSPAYQGTATRTLNANLVKIFMTEIFSLGHVWCWWSGEKHREGMPTWNYARGHVSLITVIDGKPVDRLQAFHPFHACHQVSSILLKIIFNYVLSTSFEYSSNIWSYNYCYSLSQFIDKDLKLLARVLAKYSDSYWPYVTVWRKFCCYVLFY